MPQGQKVITWERVRKALQGAKKGRTTKQIAQLIANKTDQEIPIAGCYTTLRYFEKVGRLTRTRVGQNSAWALRSLGIEA